MFYFLHRIICQDVSAYSFGSWCSIHDPWQCLAGGRRPVSVLEALEILVNCRDDKLAVGSWSRLANVLDDHMRLVGIAGAELLEHGSAYLVVLGK
jgi:hypothetical protein